VASPEVGGLVMSLWIYVKFMLLTLFATFVIHLALRGYWVALAGLSSVYPDGIRWDRLEKRMGPLYLAASRRDIGDMPTTIERADNRASRVFGIGFGLAMMMLLPIVLVGTLITVVWLWGVLADPGETALVTALVVFVALTSMFGVVVAWDRYRTSKMRPDGAEARVLRALLGFYLRIGFARTNNPLLTLFSSNEGTSRTMLVVGGVMTFVFAMLAVEPVAGRFGWSLGDYAGLPPDRREAVDTVLPEHYASQRSADPQLYPMPYIPDPVVRGDYVRLFVPYFPQRHNPAMAKNCAAEMAATGDAAGRARLDCLARIHAVAIDGVPQAVRFDAAEDPKTGQRGMLAMIRVAELAPGRHELTLMPAARQRDIERNDGKPIPPYRIPFWR
jgi:hypothetical protein